MFALAGWKIYKKRVGQKQTNPIWKQRGIGCGRPRVGAWVGIDGCVSNGIARNRPSPRLIALTSPSSPSPKPSHPSPPCNCRHPRFYQASHNRVFFRRSRLFFREAAFFSGGEGCEWRAPRATVGKSGDKTENEFSGFIPLTVPRKGFSPHIPASRLFVLFHTSKPTIPPSPCIAFKFFLRNIWEIGGKIRIFAPHLRLWRNW